ncbi:uncharacterized protein LOC126904227 [Daktulosphaira vitifoliae]|uniref:uncharacterized protein LOC126904227 n=1 Tax=Daktulosphaira vitifoliae TaxID=58002 RepID=UPI0021AA7906|nr:uncharacterized protein LOC126904227 [Daktulosphaira vitifoliae]
MFLLNIFKILWLYHNIILITAGPGKNLFSKIFSPKSNTRFSSELSTPLINEVLTSSCNNKNASSSTDSPSNNLVKYVTGMYSINFEWHATTKYLIADHYFQPVDSEWREQISNKLEFQTIKTYTTDNLKKKLKSPKCLDDVKVSIDENIFYKKISLLFSGTQNNYKIFREMVFKVVKQNENIATLLGGDDKRQQYVNSGHFNKTGVVEMIASSIVIETCIYLYIKKLNWWLYIPKDWSKKTISKMSEEKCIYLSGEGRQYFIVEDVVD